jgi:four helix bundle protein
MSPKISRVEEMPVFQGAYALALVVERETRYFPGDFRWLRNQVLRSSESVCSNMVEGFYAQYTTEYLQSLHRCKREGHETLFHLRYARDSVLRLDLTDLEEPYEGVLLQLNALIRSLESKLALYGKSKPSPGPGHVREPDVPYGDLPNEPE